MSRKLGKAELMEMLYGATFLGAGGGGSLHLGDRILNNLGKNHKIEVEMLDISEMEDGAYGAMGAGLGSPKAITAPDISFIDVVNAFKGLQKEMEREGKPVKYIYSGEYGGLNTAMAMYISILTGCPLLDLDSNLRAVPELNTGLLPIFGYPPYPVVLSNVDGDTVVVRTADPNNSKGAEVIARQLCMAYNMKIGFSTWPVNREEIEKYLVPGSLTHAGKIGKAILDAKAAGTDPVKQIAAVTEMREICRGKIEKVDLVARDGFDFGTTTFDSDKGKVVVHFKNENMVVMDGTGNVIMTVPESICLLELDTCTPLTNADVEEGMNVSLIALPAREPWWRIPEGFTCWQHIIEKMGIQTGPVRY